MSRSVNVKNLVRERSALRERIRLLRGALELIAEGERSLMDAKIDATDALTSDDAAEAELAKAEKAAKEAKSLAPPPGPLPGMVAGYWFEETDVIPSCRPSYGPHSALLPPLPGARAPDLVLVERAGGWFPMSDAAMLTYSFTRAGEGVRFVAWGPQGRLVQRSRFVLVEAGTVGRLYGPEVAERCSGGRRIVGVQAMFEPPSAGWPRPAHQLDRLAADGAVEDRVPDMSGVTAESIAKALAVPALAVPAPPQPRWLPLREAAPLLSMTEAALRKALERRASRVGDVTVADLDGIRGRKVGRLWRVSLAVLDAQLTGPNG